MAKDPAFLFYSSDFLTGTMTMTNEQVGKYIRLLCLQHQKGFLCETDMNFICGSYDKQIFDKFEKVDDTYINKRLKIEAEKRANFCKSRAENRDGKKNTKPKKIRKTYDEHMENENEDENVIINKAIIDSIYSLYPTKCSIRNASNGKCEKNKEQIKKLLDKYSEAELKTIIENYVKNCTATKTYMKNFTTFLNNLPIDLLNSIPVIKTPEQKKEEYNEWLRLQGKGVTYLDMERKPQ